MQELNLKEYKIINYVLNEEDYKAHPFSGGKEFVSVNGHAGRQVVIWGNVNLNTNFISEVINNEEIKVVVYYKYWDELSVFFGVKKRRSLITEKISKRKKKNSKNPNMITFARFDYNRDIRNVFINREMVDADELVYDEHFYEINLITKTIVMYNGNRYKVFISLNF